MASDDEDRLTREEAKRILRRLELDAYSSVITAFRAQGDLNREKKQALADLASHLSISNERHRAEVRRVVNDDSLDAVAGCMHGTSTGTEWSIEGKRLVSLTPRLVPQTVFTAKATHTANAVSQENSKVPVKKGPPQSPRERSVLINRKIEKSEEKYKVHIHSPEPARNGAPLSASGIKGQESDKAKKKKKQNQMSNKLLKSNKINLQPKGELKSSSSTILSKNLLSPTNAQRTVLPDNSQGAFHQKPIILQRSPHKASSSARPHSSDASLSSHFGYSAKAASSSAHPVSCVTSAVISSSNQQRQITIDNKGSSSAANTLIKSAHGLTSTENTFVVQKVKFKTPIAKSKTKSVKPKAGTILQRPSNICVSHSAESLNVLATSTVVPMAPISPVKPVIPSNVGQSSGVTNADGPDDRSNSAVKVVPMQKSTNTTATQSLSASSAAKSFVVVSSTASTKAGNAQRVLALGNVPLSGNQPLKIASIPNVLQQSGAKIVSIAKSMPMTTGFKMIAVTTVVPGSTQVKTVYIATPIMSVTKTSSQLQGTVCNQTSATKLLQTLVSGSTPVRPAQTDVSPSNMLAAGRPSLGLVTPKGFTPPATSSPIVKATVFTTASSGLSDIISTTSLASAATPTHQVSTSNEFCKPVVSSSKDNGSVSLQGISKSPEIVTSSRSTISSGTSKVVGNEGDFHQVKNATESKVVCDDKNVSSMTNDRSSHPTNQIDTNNQSIMAQNEAASDNADETILLAGEKFLADLAAKFSKSTSELTPAILPNSDLGRVDELASESSDCVKVENATATKRGSQSSDFKPRIHVQRDESKVCNVVESKVIVRKIGDEYDSPIKMDTEPEVERKGNFADKHTSLTAPLVTKDSDGAQQRNFKEIDVPAQMADGTGVLDTGDNSRPVSDHNLMQAFENTNVAANFDSHSRKSVNDTKKNLDEPSTSPDQTNALLNQHSINFDINDQPRNIFSSFFPTNGSADAGSMLISKSMKDSSQLIPSPTQHSAEGSDKSELGLASPACVPMNYKKLPNNNKNDNFGSKPSREMHNATLSTQKQTVLPVTSSEITLDNRKLSSSAVDCKYLNERQTSANFSHSQKTSIESITISKSPVNASPLNSPKKKSNSISPSVDRRNSNRKIFLPTNTEIEASSSNEGSNDLYNLQSNHSFTGLIVDVSRTTTNELLHGNKNENLHEDKLLKHSARTLKGNSNSRELNVLSGDVSSENTGNSFVGSSGTHKPHNDKRHVAITENSRGISKKRKSDAVISAGWIKGALTLLHRVSRFRGPNKQKGEMNAASWFTRPVDPAEAPGYYKVIKKPMDFSTVRKKLEGGAYKDFTEFYSDMHLIKANCYTYNPAEHIARKDCDLVFTFFEEECYKFLQKQQNPQDSPSKKSKIDVAL